MDVPRIPSGQAIRRADVAYARSMRGLCPECAAPVNEDGGCDVCREEGQRCDCDPPEPAVPQSVKDALADAETLLINDPRVPRLSAVAGNLGSNARVWIAATLRTVAPRISRSLARQAAHAAFRACPGLRG